jgi:hypothetical protein
MKTFNFSKEDLEYLMPVEANKQALETAVKVYIVNAVMPRLGLKPTDMVRYDVFKGTLQLTEPKDMEAPPTGKEPEVKKPEEPKVN